MARPEKPLDPNAGPVAQFADALRRLRHEAQVPYRVMAQQTGHSLSTLSQAAAGAKLPSLAVALAYVEACGAGADRAVWEARWHEAEQAVRQAATAARAEEETDGPGPYRGLARYEPADSNLFFGRGALTDQLVALVARERLSVLVGPSGSGKSSLLRAGLIPRLQHHDSIGELRVAALRICTPGPRPASEHEKLFTPCGTDTGGAAGGDTCLIIDQFEEVFTLCADTDERDAFLQRILAVRTPDSGLRVVLGVRADFYAHCLRHPGLADVLRVAALPVGPMAPDELREAITKPAAAHRLIVERTLTTRLIDDVSVEPGALPLLSHALLETWRHRTGRTLSLDAYRAAGGLHGAVARTAETLYTSLTSGQARIARRILLRLIAPGDNSPDTRRPADRTELDDRRAGPEAAVVLDRLARARLITLENSTVHLAHEALITAWPRLQEWINDDRERLRLHRRLTEAARSWQEQGRDRGALLRGTRLAATRAAFATPHLDAVIRARSSGWYRMRSTVGRWPVAAPLRAVRQGISRGQLGASAMPMPPRGPGPRSWWSRGRGPTPGVPGAAGDLTSLEWEFLAASGVAAAREHRGRRAMVASLAVLVVLALVAAVLAWGQRQNARTAQRQTQSRQLAARSGMLRDSDPDLASLLAVAAYRTSPTAEAVLSLSTAAGLPLRYRLPGPSSVSAVAFSPDGKTLATSDDAVVRLWDVSTGRPRATLADHTAGGVTSMAFSPDGKTLAAGSTDHTVRLWDVADGKPRATLTGHTAGVVSVTFSPGGTVVASADTNQRVRLWDVASGTPRGDLAEATAGAVSLAFSPDRKTLASGGLDGRVRLWDVATGAPRGVLLTGHTGSITTMAFSPDGETLATGSHDSSVRLWDMAAGKARRVLTDTDGISTVVFSPDGKTLASMGLGRGVRLWDAATGRGRSVLSGSTGDTHAVVFSPDGKTLATSSSDQTVRLWDTTTGKSHSSLVGHDDAITAVAFSPDGKTLATGSKDFSVRLWDVTAGKPPGVLISPDIVTAVAFSPDGETLATGGQDSSLRLWNTATGKTRTTLNGHTAGVTSLSFSPDGKTLATGSSDRTVRLWDTATGTHRATLNGHTTGVTSVAFSPDGTTLATSGLDTTVRLWDVATGTARGVLTGHTGNITALAFSPDGKTLATGSEDFLVQLWNMAGGRPRGLLTGHTARVTTLAFSPDGRTLATGSDDRTVRLWDTATNRMQNTFTGHTESIRSMAFSRDGRTLATGGQDQTVQLWDTGAARTRTTLTGHTAAVTSLAFSPDDRTLATGSADRTTRLWNVALPTPAAAMQKLCTAVHRDFTPQERSDLPDLPSRPVCRS